MTNSTAASSIYSPRHWPLWAGFALGRLFALLPVALQIKIGLWVGRLGGHFGGRHRNIARRNISVCFPELDTNEQTALLNGTFASLGAGIVETNLSWWISDKRLRRRIDVLGETHLRNAQADKRGIILMGVHSTTLEIGGRILNTITTFNAVYRRYRNPVIEYQLRKLRERHYGKLIPAKDLRAIISGLKKGQALWYLSDENFGHKNRVFAPFFGTLAASNPAPVRLAKVANAHVVPFAVKRNGSRYEIRFFPRLENFPSGSIAEDVALINSSVEKVILHAPDQYLWIQKRFKTRPAGDMPFYDQP